MMVGLGEADGMVAGASHATASVLQAAGLAIGYREGILLPSSSFIMVVPRLGERTDVPLVFADCAVNVEPSAEALAGIALAAADTARKLLGVIPRVAMLSFSTKGSAGHPKVELVRRATELAAAKIQNGFVDGELQLDAAVSPAVARKKIKGSSEVAGQANVLVFPDLNAGNIAYKAVQYLGGARAIGPILQGFAKPVSDLSRGASVEDIVDMTAVTVLQAQ
jgi:phosphate acetyltransferase